MPEVVTGVEAIGHEGEAVEHGGGGVRWARCESEGFVVGGNAEVVMVEGGGKEKMFGEAEEAVAAGEGAHEPGLVGVGVGWECGVLEGVEG